MISQTKRKIQQKGSIVKEIETTMVAIVHLRDVTWKNEEKEQDCQLDTSDDLWEFEITNEDLSIKRQYTSI